MISKRLYDQRSATAKRFLSILTSGRRFVIESTCVSIYTAKVESSVVIAEKLVERLNNYGVDMAKDVVALICDGASVNRAVACHLQKEDLVTGIQGTN